MPYPESIRQQEISKADSCAICREKLPKDAYIEVHSATSLHLVRDEETGKYCVTDPPVGHEKLKGKLINWNVLRGRKTDGVCLCPVCHDEIHRIAREEARRNGFSGNAPPPEVLEEVTLYFAQRGRPIADRVVRTP